MTFRFKFCAASLLALAMFTGGAHAEGEAAQQPVAQEQPVTSEGPLATLPEVVLLLQNDKRGSAELSDDELRARFDAVREASKLEGLPDDVRGQLQAMADADKAEIENRKAAAEQPKEQAPAAAEQQPAQEQQPAPKAEAVQPAPPPIPDDVLALLNDKRAAGELSEDDLRQRFKSTRKALKMDGVPDDARTSLQALMDADKAELENRKSAAEQKPAEAPKADAPAVVETQPARPVVEPPKQPEPAPAIVTQETGAAAVAPPAPEPVQSDKTQVQALDGNSGDPVAEKKAKVFLGDATPAASLSDEALRARLDGMRDLLAENELSSATERALRKKLRDEREVLRDRVAEVKAKQDAKAFADAQAMAETQAKAQAAAPQPPPVPGQAPKPMRDGRQRKHFDFNIIITPDMPRRDILRDRRPADELQEEELRRRIEAYRDVQTEDRYLDYDPGVRNYWRQSMQRDRLILRERMLAQRAERAAQYRREQTRVNLNDLAFADDEASQDVFAAEVDDQQIEDVIVAPPRRKVQKRYAVKDFASNRQLRESVSHVEVDTIHFGFNEAFVREEEVDNLDQVASVMEKVLRKYPREVFLIEGHTDAVGSDAYNIKLSRARAEAVKKTLLTYYLIPAKNLATVGLGERYLKIPTADPEPENRRVSISRITAFVGQAPQ
jgi:outer membrane protein OmpA-like peptidoglycan-associated protein